MIQVEKTQPFLFYRDVLVLAPLEGSGAGDVDVYDWPKLYISRPSLQQVGGK